MTLLLDTDVLLDVALDRAPFVADSARLLDELATRPGLGYIAWHSASNFYYLVAPAQGEAGAREFLMDLTRFIEVAATGTDALRPAGSLRLADFEDAMQVAAALACRADSIVTRNTKDYRNSPVPAITPRTALERIRSGDR